MHRGGKGGGNTSIKVHVEITKYIFFLNKIKFKLQCDKLFN